MSSTDAFVRQNFGIFVAVRTDVLKTKFSWYTWQSGCFRPNSSRVRCLASVCNLRYNKRHGGFSCRLVRADTADKVYGRTDLPCFSNVQHISRRTSITIQ